MQYSPRQFPHPSNGSREAIGVYFDELSGRHFIVARPTEQPQLWAEYLDGAMQSYRQHHVESAIEYSRVRDGHSTSLFITAVEADGRVVGGMRVQGPYTAPDQAHAVREWAGRTGTRQLRAEISSRLPEGVVEIKAVWVEQDAPRHHELTNALARSFVHAIDALGVRYGLCTAGSHAVPSWQTSGGVVSPDICPVPYPDDRYRTVPMWWDRRTLSETIAADQVAALLSEAAQLRGEPSVLATSLPSVA